MRSLVLGGARSGKSAYAERLAAGAGKEVIYIATARAGDGEMAARIARHRQERDTGWQTIEEPIALAQSIRHWAGPERVLLIDCLTLWLTNLLFSAEQEFPEVGHIVPPALFDAQRGLFLDALSSAAGDIILVSNEVGMGIVPQGAVSRWFVDEAGRLNQAVAAACDRVVFVAAGLPLKLKG
jgi:adenosylcobinamide kinase/adenosylcobinamide-phosphate guanylyltransferase